MTLTIPRPIILCEECECEAVECRGGRPHPRIVQCRDCGLALGTWEEWLHLVEERVRDHDMRSAPVWFGPDPVVH